MQLPMFFITAVKLEDKERTGEDAQPFHGNVKMLLDEWWCSKDFCFSFRTKQFNVLFSLFPFLFAMQCFEEHSIYLEEFLIVETSYCCLSKEFPHSGLLSMG